MHFFRHSNDTFQTELCAPSVATASERAAQILRLLDQQHPWGNWHQSNKAGSSSMSTCKYGLGQNETAQTITSEFQTKCLLVACPKQAAEDLLEPPMTSGKLMGMLCDLATSLMNHMSKVQSPRVP